MPTAYSRRKCIGNPQKSKSKNKNVNEWSDSEKRIEARLARDQAKLAEIRRRKYSKSTPRRLHVPAIESSIVRVMLTLSSGATTGASSETNRSTYAARLPPLFRSRTSQITLTTTGTSSSPRAFLWVQRMTGASTGAMARVQPHISPTPWPCASHGASTLLLSA